MKLHELFDLSGDFSPKSSGRREPKPEVEETLLQLAYDQVDGKEAFICMYVVAGEIINALHRMASYNPLFVNRMNQDLLRCAERAKVDAASKS